MFPQASLTRITRTAAPRGTRAWKASLSSVSCARTRFSCAAPLLHAEHGHAAPHPPRQCQQRFSLPGSG